MKKREIMTRLAARIETLCLEFDHQLALPPAEHDPEIQAELEWMLAIQAFMQGSKHHAIRPGPHGPIPKGVRPLIKRKLQDSEREIIALIQTDPSNHWHMHDLIQGTKQPSHTTKNCLTRLVRDGYIVRVGRGFYTARPPSSETATDEPAST